ncbi:MAG: HAD-IA family hydrolase [Pseudomonadota bacterium]
MKLVVFDVDGTLVDSQHMIVAAMDCAFAAIGAQPPSRQETLSIVGLSLREAMQALTGADQSTIDSLTESYKAAFFELRSDPAHNEPLYPGADHVLDQLSARDDVLLGIATGKSRRGVDRVLERFDLQGRFVTIQTADNHPSKPHPAMLFEALSESGIDAARAVMIGDTVFDMEMASAAKIPAIGVAWGYHDAAHLRPAGALHVADDYPHLLRLLDAQFNDAPGEDRT